MKAEIIEKAGLSSSEAKIYFTLLRIGDCKAGRVATETGFDRTTVYKKLERLTKLGLVSTVIKENRKYFEPANPKNLIKQLEYKEQELQDRKQDLHHALPFLADLFEKQEEDMKVSVYKTTKGLKTVFNDIIRTLHSGEEYLAFGIPEYSETILGYWEEFNKAFKHKKLKGRLIFNEDARNNIRLSKKYKYKVRTLSKEFMSPAEINIYEKKVAIVLWEKTPLAILIKSDAIAKSFRQYFKVLWTLAASRR